MFCTVIALVLLTFSNSALAGEPSSHDDAKHDAHPPTLSLVNGLTYTTGDHGLASVMTVHGARVAFLVAPRFKWSVEAGAVVGLPALDLGAYGQTGPGVIVSQRFQTSLYATWKMHGHEETVGYEVTFGEEGGATTHQETEMEHLLGVAVAPTFVTGFGNLNLPLGFQCAIGGDCMGVLGMKLVIDVL